MTSTILRSLTRSLFSNTKKQTQTARWDSTYKAALVRDPAKALEFEDQKRSKLEDNQVRVRVQYCSVNSIDIINFKNPKRKLPFTPGYEIAGEIIEVGKAVTTKQIRIGEKIAALSLDNFGGFAQECVLKINEVFRLPTNVEVKEAAVLLSAHGTALFAFSEKCRVKEGDYVLVSAGIAGLGLAAEDVAADVYGAKVISVYDSNEIASLLRDRGTFQTLAYGPKLEKDVLSATKGDGVKVVFDAVGEHMFESMSKCVAPGGSIFHVAPTTPPLIPAPPRNCNLTILSFFELRKHDFEMYQSIVNGVLDLADQGTITAHISQKYKLKSINEAIKMIDEKKATGKVLIEVDD